MTRDQSIAAARTSLKTALEVLTTEIRDYPTPVSGCDAQYNYLLGQRRSVSDALRLLDEPAFVATPRTPEPGAGIESR